MDMNAKILLMTALLGGASVLSFVGCSSDDDKKNDNGGNSNGKDDAGGGGEDKDSGGGGGEDKDSGGGGGGTVDCGGSACEQACEKAAAASCGDGDAISATCKQAIDGKGFFPSCADAIDAAIACFNDKATYSCEGGKTVPSGCDDEFSAAGACITSALADAGS